MESQALTIEQMQELEELGIDTSKASMFWYNCDRFRQLIPCSKQNTIKDWTNQHGENCIIPAFTLQDILEMLPTHKTFSEYNKTYNRCWVRLCSPENDNIHTELSNKSLLEAAFNMLKWCKENKFI